MSLQGKSILAKRGLEGGENKPHLRTWMKKKKSYCGNHGEDPHFVRRGRANPREGKKEKKKKKSLTRKKRPWPREIKGAVVPWGGSRRGGEKNVYRVGWIKEGLRPFQRSVAKIRFCKKKDVFNE